ncbi:hypothetical protein F5X68DRAFT_189908 [Plectosphaerella plurivora]|uniref:Uncharacterized protein n=1 Tax=Plectosphaerella plurivora TaxID=936078 RepID=A0A9P9ABN1_9PEZI|nr:hypothetical protein F5X68DRAFT_189908 [Plectosphaerella plurivora]
MAEKQVGTYVALTPPEEGKSIWHAKQVDLERAAPGDGVQGHENIYWEYGSTQIYGYVDTNTLVAYLDISVVGLRIGHIYGNLKQGLGIEVDLHLAKGGINVYLKNGNEVWVRLDLDVTILGTKYEEDYKITELSI